MEKLYMAIGTITHTKANERKALARVNICGRITDFLPVISIANSFKRHFIPSRVGEQVLVLYSYAEINKGVILPSLFNRSCKENEGGSESREIITYEDGTRISYDTSNHTLEIDSTATINIKCKEANISANNVRVDSPSIDLGLGGAGVVTSECICAFTGAPHPQGSQNTRSKI